jgi:hypothetical protein
MRKLKWVAGVALTMGLAVLPTLGQEPAKKNEAPKAAPSRSQTLLGAWNHIGGKLIGGQVRLQAEAGAAFLCGTAPARVQRDVLFYERGGGEKPARR